MHGELVSIGFETPRCWCTPFPAFAKYSGGKKKEKEGKGQTKQRGVKRGENTSEGKSMGRKGERCDDGRGLTDGRRLTYPCGREIRTSDTAGDHRALKWEKQGNNSSMKQPRKKQPRKKQPNGNSLMETDKWNKTNGIKQMEVRNGIKQVKLRQVELMQEAIENNENDRQLKSGDKAKGAEDETEEDGEKQAGKRTKTSNKARLQEMLEQVTEKRQINESMLNKKMPADEEKQNGKKQAPKLTTEMRKTLAQQLRDKLRQGTGRVCGERWRQFRERTQAVELYHEGRQ